VPQRAATIVGVDFGAPRRERDQRRKIIAIRRSTDRLAPLLHRRDGYERALACEELARLEREGAARRAARQSARRIARETGLDRKTVGRYLEQAGEHGVEPQTPVTDEIAGAVGKRVQARPPPA
jgi:hypothetical protein